MDIDQTASLVTAAQAGNRSAFSALAGLYNRQVAAAVMAELLCTPDELQDALQDIWVAAWRSLPGLKDPERFGAWLYSVARNRTRSLRQRLRRDQDRTWSAASEDDDDPLEGLSAPADSDPAKSITARHLLHAALAQLPPKERIAFFLRVVAEPPWDYVKISEVLGAKEIAARVAYSRACKRLATWWQQDIA